MAALPIGGGYKETALTMAIVRATSAAALQQQSVVSRYRTMAIKLLRHGADPNFKDFTGKSSLKKALDYRDAGLIKELKVHGATE